MQRELPRVLSLVGRDARKGKGRGKRPGPMAGERVGSNPDLVDPLLKAHQALQLALRGVESSLGYSGDATLGELVTARLAAGEKQYTRSTMRTYRSDLRAVLDRVGDRPLKELTAGDLEQAIDDVPAGRWNALTRCWRAALQWAHRHGYPGATVLMVQLRAHRPGRVVYRPEVWDRALEALIAGYRDAPARSQAAAGAALCSHVLGVRRGGVVSMRWDGVDQRQGTCVVVDKGVTRVVKLGVVAGPLVLTQPRSGPWVWPSRQGSSQGHVCANTVSRHVRRVFDLHGLKGLTLHQAGRHAAACAALARGANVHEVAAHLGHVDTRMVTERYTSPGRPDGARAVLDGAIGRDAWEAIAK